MILTLANGHVPLINDLTDHVNEVLTEVLKKLCTAPNIGNLARPRHSGSLLILSHQSKTTRRLWQMSLASNLNF